MKYIGLYIILVLGSLNGCTEFLSPDAKDEAVEIISPSDLFYAADTAVSFWWEENDKAENYRFQLVSPDFENPTLVFDTLTLETLIQLRLDEGRYIWRIRIENEGSESEYQERDFVIDHTLPLVPQAISPLHNGMLNGAASKQILTWKSQDPAIDGVSFPTMDSIFLRPTNSNGLISSHFVDLEEDKSWDLAGLELTRDRNYTWEVISIDQAGNKRESSFWNFYLQ